MRYQLLLTCALIASLMMVSCTSLPPPVIEQIKPQPPVLLVQCPPLPAPGDNSCDAAAVNLSQVYADYGLCAGRLVELVKRVNQDRQPPATTLKDAPQTKQGAP